MKLRRILIPLLLVLLLILYLSNLPLPEGELIMSSVSPNGLYQVNGYRCDGGATVNWAIRAEVVTISTGKKRNIYWKYHAYDVEIKWISDELVCVNGVTLNIHSDMYDYRKH